MDRLLSKFVLARHIRNVVDLRTVDFTDRAIQHDDSMLAVSQKVRSFYANNDSTGAEQAAFAKEVRAFYCAVVTKMVAKFPFGDPVLRDLGVIDPAARVNLNYEPIVRLAARFSPDVDAEQLKEEYEDFQLLREDAITLVEDGESRPFEHVWADILAMKTPLGVIRFPLMATVIVPLLSLLNSNAEVERLFSILRKSAHRSATA